MSVPFDYDTDPERYRRGMRCARGHATHSLYQRVADILTTDPTTRTVLDVGCADGVLRAALPPDGPRLIGLDTSEVLAADHPAPVVRADAGRLPFRTAALDAVTALNVYYHLPDPRPAIVEAHRVLRPGGTLIAATIARDDSPELVDHWTRPATSFDAEDAPALVGRVFHTVTAHPWDAPLVTLPTPAAIRDYLRGRQAPPGAADTAARELATPLTVTKRGVLIVASTRDAGQ